MARTKATYTVVRIVNGELMVHDGLDFDAAARVIGSGATGGGEVTTEILLFKGEPIPFEVETTPRVSIGATKRTRKPRTVEPGAELKKRARPRKANGASDTTEASAV